MIGDIADACHQYQTWPGCCRSPSRRFATPGFGPTGGASSPSATRGRATSPRRMKSTLATSPSFLGSSMRIRIWSSRGCADASRKPTNFGQWIRSVIDLRMTAGQATRRMRDRRGHSRSPGVRHGADRRRVQHAGPRGAEGAGAAGVVFHELLGFRSADAGADAGSGGAQAREGAGSRAAHAGAARAVFRVAGAVRSDPRCTASRIRSRARACTSVSPQRKSSFSNTARARGATCSKGWGMGSRVGSAAVQARRVCRSDGVSRRARARRARRAVRCAGARGVAARGATLVTCPRGNIRTGAGTPPIAEFFEAGVRVAVGTDSLASVPDLNCFAELAEMRRLAPGSRRACCSRAPRSTAPARWVSTPTSARSMRESATGWSPSTSTGTSRMSKSVWCRASRPQISWLPS